MAEKRKANYPFLKHYLTRSIIKNFYSRIKRFWNQIKYIKCGDYVSFGRQFRFSTIKPFQAFIGDNVWVSEYNVFNARYGDIKIGNNCDLGIRNIIMGPVEIGDNSSTGPNVCILGPNHAFGHHLKTEIKKTVIGNNAWISTGTIILNGVIIGNNVVIGPGSLVNRDVPDNAFVMGNPIRDLTNIVKF
jgi:acetyltransferase-like isoleucine patch superfamily enzyme